MRMLRDDNGQQWMVFEVRRRGGPHESWTYLPSGYGDGWLCFESSAGKRRLTSYPDDWRDLDDAALLSLLHAAEPARKDARTAAVEKRPPKDGSDASAS